MTDPLYMVAVVSEMLYAFFPLVQLFGFGLVAGAIVLHGMLVRKEDKDA